jgi:hypothetical protein
MIEKKSEIKISFTLEGPGEKEIDIDELTKYLAIKPTKTRTLNDWPDAIKHPKNELPNDLKPRSCWTVEIDYEHCSLVRNQFAKMIDVLYNKVAVINSLKEKHHLKAHFEVVIYAHHDQMPEVFLTKENIEFIASIGAEIGFDMYLN